ncbi:unnamed protein product, partial [Mesorhabditis spiculigera]
MCRLLCIATALAVLANCQESPAAILGPLVQKYQDYIYEKQYDKLEALYHPNAVLIIDGQVTPFFQPKNIFAQIEDSRSRIGNVKTTFVKESYSGASDVLMYENQWKINTAKTEMTGPYRAIWIKYNGNWVIYHEEYSQFVKQL